MPYYKFPISLPRRYITRASFTVHISLQILRKRQSGRRETEKEGERLGERLSEDESSAKTDAVPILKQFGCAGITLLYTCRLVLCFATNYAAIACGKTFIHEEVMLHSAICSIHAGLPLIITTVFELDPQ